MIKRLFKRNNKVEDKLDQLDGRLQFIIDAYHQQQRREAELQAEMEQMELAHRKLEQQLRDKLSQASSQVETILQRWFPGLAHTYKEPNDGHH